MRTDFEGILNFGLNDIENGDTSLLTPEFLVSL